MQRLTSRIHFDDFSGQQFERLCFAYLLRRHDGARVNWYGQLGGDRGRDIICAKSGQATIVVQCANFQRLSFAKAQADLGKLAASATSRGAHFTLIAGGSVSGTLKDRIIAAATQAGFASADVISGAEFEEALRLHVPELLRRFVEGAEFPEIAEELSVFARTAADVTDEEIIAALTLAFDRPAYRTHFQQESSLPRFKEAIAETIRTLNTGETPQGARMPSRHQVRDTARRATLDRLVGLLVNLRALFDEALRTGSVKPCGCKQADCPVFFVQPDAAHDLDRRRHEILMIVHELNPRFSPAFY
jgi:hypothetical protein